MDSDLKRTIDRAFDEERLPEEAGVLRRAAEGDDEALAYLDRLLAVDSCLAQPEEVEVPAGFRAAVLGRLPRRAKAPAKSAWWRDLLMPAYVAVVVVISLLFRDALGITAVLNSAAEALAGVSGSSGGLEFAFLAVSSAVILLAAWALVAGFFGIRSRRISR